MSQKWMVKKYSTAITPIECVSETAKFVTIRKSNLFDGGFTDTRAARMSSYECYFDTWHEAHKYLTERAENRLTAARIELQKAQGEHGNIIGMNPPDTRS